MASKANKRGSASKPSRGSKGLAVARAIGKEDLRRVLTILKGRGIKVVDWQVLGQPVPDSVTGTVHVSRAATPQFIAKLINLSSGTLRPSLDVFPNGIPLPDIFRVRFRI